MISRITKTVTDESRQEALPVPVSGVIINSALQYTSNVRRRLLLMFQLKRLGPVSDIRNAANISAAERQATMIDSQHKQK